MRYGKRIGSWIGLLGVFLLALVFFALGAKAQETTADLQGYVKDQSGGTIPKATVEITSPALIGSKKKQTDEAGYFRFHYLPPGEYTLTVSAPNFRTYKQTGITLDVGKLPTIDVALQIGQMAEILEVSGKAPIVEVTTSKAAVTIPEEVLKNLPRGQSFQSLISFAPGARQEPLQSASRLDPGHANGFQIDGASDSENTYLVEGLDTSDVNVGGIKVNVPFEFVQELQIKTSGFEAEYGGAVGGVVNVVHSRGSNNWHGSVLAKYFSDALNANDQCQLVGAPNSFRGQPAETCGLIGNPATSIDSTNRIDQAFEYYQGKKDHRRIVDPGFTIGGPIFTDKLWLFASYLPSFDRIRRGVVFTGANAGFRTFNRTFDQHNGLARLDYRPVRSLNLYGSWQYFYSRLAGILPAAPDSVSGQTNQAADTDPNTLQSDTGSVNPGALYVFGGDWTPTARLVISARYGYLFYNTSDRGKPVGIRYLFDGGSLTTTTPGLDGNPINPSGTFAHSQGFSNIQDNVQTVFDAFKRKAFNADVSYFVSKWGTHNLKFGYSNNRLSNDVLNGYNTALVFLNYGQDYSPITSPTVCNTVIAANVAQFGPSAAGHCRGNAGYFIVGQADATTVGAVSSLNHGIYLQDSWTVGRGLTLNVGVRFDKEFLPPYRAGASSISFAFTDKVSPRIGAAYDLLHNGKLKIYGSYGKFFDIMKYSLPRGSFGGDYWHNCAYAMDDPNFNNIAPSNPGAPACPGSGPALGVTVGRFIENVDFRKNILNPVFPGVDPNIKPMQQHEYVVGADWAFLSNLGLEIRYSRKRLDETIEDIGITDDFGFYIGNPGPNTFADLLHRATPDFPAQCLDCPRQPRAIRNYDAVEFRLTKRASTRWFGSVSYTYSRLRGNYSGLTDSDITDREGGRHSPNNHRAFDYPDMQFTAHGQFQDGPLSTDRPNTLKLIGWYRLSYWGMESTFGLFQSIFSGTPTSTCWAVIGSTSSCVYVENRGNFVKFHRASNGDFVSDGIIQDFRTPRYINTDFSFKQEFKVNKSNEAMRVSLEWDVLNLLNQHSVLSINPVPLAGGATVTIPTTSNASGVDWKALLTGWDYVAVSNSQNKIVSNRYGLPNLFQASRTMRFILSFKF